MSNNFFLTHRCAKHDMTLHFIELFQKSANVNVHIDLHMARGRWLSLIKRFIVEDIYIYIFIFMNFSHVINHINVIVNVMQYVSFDRQSSKPSNHNFNLWYIMSLHKYKDVHFKLVTLPYYYNIILFQFY